MEEKREAGMNGREVKTGRGKESREEGKEKDRKMKRGGKR